MENKMNLQESIRNDLNRIDEDNDNPFEKLGLSTRWEYLLKHAQIFSIGDLLQKTEEEILRMPNFGRKGLDNVILPALNKLGLQLKNDSNRINVNKGKSIYLLMFRGLGDHEDEFYPFSAHSTPESAKQHYQAYLEEWSEDQSNVDYEIHETEFYQ